MEEEASWAARNADGKVSTRPLGLAVKHRLNLLPTPIANDSTGSEYCYGPKARPGEERKRFLKLKGALKLNLLPTPTARDWKDSPGMKLERPDGTSRLDQLPRRLFSDLNAKTGLKLNPQWCLWFMGYPTEWLKPLYAALEIQSARKSRSASSTPSAPN